MSNCTLDTTRTAARKQRRERLCTEDRPSSEPVGDWPRQPSHRNSPANEGLRPAVDHDGVRMELRRRETQAIPTTRGDTATEHASATRAATRRLKRTEVVSKSNGCLAGQILLLKDPFPVATNSNEMSSPVAGRPSVLPKSLRFNRTGRVNRRYCHP